MRASAARLSPLLPLLLLLSACERAPAATADPREIDAAVAKAERQAEVAKSRAKDPGQPAGQ